MNIQKYNKIKFLQIIKSNVLNKIKRIPTRIKMFLKKVMNKNKLSFVVN